MIYKYLKISPEESLSGTICLNTLSLLQNIRILRVHDVKESVQTVRLLEKIFNPYNV